MYKQEKQGDIYDNVETKPRESSHQLKENIIDNWYGKTYFSFVFQYKNKAVL